MSKRWSLSVWLPGIAVAIFLVLVVDFTVWQAMMFLGLWVIAGAAMRILVEYVRVRRLADQAPEPDEG